MGAARSNKNFKGEGHATIKPLIAENGELTFAASVNGIAIYLDNWAISKLARHDSSLLRKRFVEAVDKGADVLFSVGHGLEIAGAQGDSSTVIKAFLNDLGPHWYPVEFAVEKVMQREREGLEPSKCCYAEELLRAFFSNRSSDCTPGSGKIIDLSESFFGLGAFVDWLAPSRSEWRAKIDEFDNLLKTQFALLRAKAKRNPGWLDTALPPMQFHPRFAANFAYRNFLRNLISDRGIQPKKGDAIDLCHAVMAAAFSNMATLDTQWKARVESLPKPNTIPHVYHRAEIDVMVDDLEHALIQFKR
jgi:hypothetical protein